MTIRDLNKVELTKIANKNPTAEAAFSVMALRERNRAETNLYRLKNELIQEGFKVVPKDFIEIFQELARIGVGELVQAKGKPARFKWNFKMLDIGKAGVQPAAPAQAMSPKKQAAAPRPAPSSPIVVHKPKAVVALLPGGREVNIDLPENMTITEAKFLAETIIKQAVNKL